MTLQAQCLQILLLSGEGLGHRDDVIDLEGPHSDGRAAHLAHALLLGQQLLPPAPSVVAPSLQQVQEHLQAGSGEALPPIGHAQALRPLLQHLRIFAELSNHTVRPAGHPQPQRGPLAQPPHGNLGVVALRQQLRPNPAKVFGPKVSRDDLSLPGLPVLKLGHGIVPLELLAVPHSPLRLVAVCHSLGRPVEEGVTVPRRKRDGPLFFLCGLEAVQQPAPTVHVEHGRVAPHAEGSDLCGGDPPVLPIPWANRIEVFYDFPQWKLQKLRQLPGHAEHVPSLLKGAGKDLVSSEELVADLSQGPKRLAQADLCVDPIVDDLHGRGAIRPLVGGVQEVNLAADHVNGFVRSGLSQLPENGLLDIASDLRVAPGIVLPGQPNIQRSHGQIVMTLVGRPVPTAASDDHGHVSEPLRVLVPEKSLSQFGHVVLSVGLQGPHDLSSATSRHDVVVRSVPNERLGLVELAVRRAPAGDAVIELPSSGQLTVGSSQEHGLQAVVPQRQKLRALR